MSRLKIDFETEDLGVIKALTFMIAGLRSAVEETPGHFEAKSNVPPPMFDERAVPREPLTAEEIDRAAFEASIILPPSSIQPLTNGDWPAAPPPPLNEQPTFTAPVPDEPELPYTPPPAGTAVELDAEGLPWDARIHSSSKAKLAKTGCWKLARGCDPALATKVTAELKVAMALPAAPQVAPPPTVPPLVTAPPPPYLPPAPVPEQQAVVPPPVAPLPTVTVPPPEVVSPPQPPAPTTGAPTTFPAFLVAVTQQQAAKRITFDEVLAVLKEHGLENIQLLTARPDLIPAIYSRLEGIWTSR